MLLSLLSKRSLEVDSRDAYGFVLRPQHIQTYREYVDIYQEEEEERSAKWEEFLESHMQSTALCLTKEKKATVNGECSPVKQEACAEEQKKRLHVRFAEATKEETEETSKSELTAFSDRTASEDGNEAALHGDDIEVKGNLSSEKENTITKEAETSVPGVEYSESLQDEDTELKEEATSKDLMKETLETKAVTLVEESGTEGSDEGNIFIMKSELVGPTEAETKEKVQPTKTKRVQQWVRTRPALLSIENLMSSRVKRAKYFKDEDVNRNLDHLLSTKEEGYSGEESKNEFDINEVLDENVNILGKESNPGDRVSSESFSWKVELESLVCGGVPKDLRGEVWQAFVGVKARRVENYYQDLLAQETIDAENNNSSSVSRKWKRQIEKDLPRTFPGHPALNDVGRESLRRLLLAYARHNPTVGYCQAMNFFAGLLLLLMPEENAFWTLVGIVDDYFGGCYTEEMVESQVDQLVFDDLMHERFPKLVNHLDYLGVQVAWISGPWFLSIFVNVIPWESVLRVWDVLLFEGNRVMLFRTAFALMELYGPALITTRDAGDAITLLQSLVGSTFDSSQLVLTACMGFLAVTEERIQQLRNKHRSSVQGVFEERDTGLAPKDPKGLASKLYSFKHDGRLPREETKSSGVSDLEPCSNSFDEFLKSLNADSENSLDLQDQVDWMKVELCRLLEEKRSAILRAEELEIALMEMVQSDNRQQLTATIEQLERENADLEQSIFDKREQESAMLKVLMRLEQEQRLAEEARRKTEQDAAAQRFAVKVLEEKYEKAMTSLAQMEKRAVVAETMLEATQQYESGQAKASSSPRAWRSSGQEPSSPRRGLLSFGLAWLDKNKGKPSPEETGDGKSSPSCSQKNADTLDHHQRANC